MFSLKPAKLPISNQMFPLYLAIVIAMVSVSTMSVIIWNGMPNPCFWAKQGMIPWPPLGLDSKVAGAEASSKNY